MRLTQLLLLWMAFVAAGVGGKRVEPRILATFDEHLGCFKDSKDRDLPRLAYSGSNSVHRCIASCRKLSYKFAGVQWSKECWCGNNYGVYGTASNCFMKCSANNRETCGGRWANNVYSVGSVQRDAISLPSAVPPDPKATVSATQPSSQSIIASPLGLEGFLFENSPIKEFTKSSSDSSKSRKSNLRNRPLTEHLGCFKDNENRDLPRLAYSGVINSVQQCRTACRRLGSNFAGVQFSRECWCGNSYGRYGLAGNCDMKCSGDRTQTCGGSWASNIYAVGGGGKSATNLLLAVDTSSTYQRNSLPVEHLGCFKDSPKRDLRHMAYSGANSVQKCQAACQRLGFKFAGVQWGTECWCGNNYGGYGTAGNCNMKCSGNSWQFCGGTWANNVYAVGRNVKSRISLSVDKSSDSTAPGVKSAPVAEHLGCFSDQSNRDLPRMAYSGVNSVKLCQVSCRRLGFQFAGVQFSKECWCGNTYGRYGPANNCNMKCSSHRGQICGGSWANNVYAVGRNVLSTIRLPGDNSFPSAGASIHPMVIKGHLGCFRDNKDRDLPQLAFSGRTNSVHLCIAACQKLGFQFAGVQFGTECWCGNKYGGYGKANNCEMACPANRRQICGGAWASNVYRVAAKRKCTTHDGRPCSAGTQMGHVHVGAALVLHQDATHSQGEETEDIEIKCRPEWLTAGPQHPSSVLRGK